MLRVARRGSVFLLLAVVWACGARATAVPSLADYGSVQAAIDANPGRMVFVPEGDHAVSAKVRIGEAGGGLYGFGRIVQSNPKEVVLEIEHADGVRIKDITLTRAAGAEDADASGLFCWDSRNVVIEGVRVVDCRARAAAIELRACTDCTVRACQVVNYKRIAIDDRTSEGENLYGYAFHAIDGTGILVNESVGSIIIDNRIVEERLLPTPEMKEQYHLGLLTEGKYPTQPGTLGEEAVKLGYVSNWHQGSAVVVTSPESTHHTVVRGNHIRNSAQGIDLHCDTATVADNVIDYAMMGVKLTHGCRNLVISGNMITHVDLWGILLNPGAASHAAEAATADNPAKKQNVDAGVIVANNLIADYGYGHEYWNYGGASDDLDSSYTIALYEGQLVDNPPLTDVLITGNMVYDTGRDGVVTDGEVTTPGPRYRYAVYVGPWGEGRQRGPSYPQGLHFIGNLFHPGARGVSNVELQP